MTTQRTCSGRGECLEQNCDSSIPALYVKYKDTTCEHNCEPVKCPNFAMCGEADPKWVLSCHDGRCLYCNMFFGKNLAFPEEPQECPICLETKPSVVQPNCSHTVCIDCFKRSRFNGPPRTGEPQFPYPDLEDEYFETGNESSNPMFFDPLVMKYNEDWNRWDNAWQESYTREGNLRKCPMCRS